MPSLKHGVSKFRVLLARLRLEISDEDFLIAGRAVLDPMFHEAPLTHKLDEPLLLISSIEDGHIDFFDLVHQCIVEDDLQETLTESIAVERDLERSDLQPLARPEPRADVRVVFVGVLNLHI